MKLNAAAEMIPITWPEFGSIHPFAPAEQAAGYAALAKDLKRSFVKSQATTHSHYSQTPAHRVSMQVLSRFNATTKAVAKVTATYV